MKSKMIIGVTLALGCAFAAGAAEVSVDFGRDAYPVRPALHSAGWGPRSEVRAIINDDARVKAMNLTYARTHDWALVNAGQRVVDYQYIFPLFDKDAKDPANYVFGPTDHLLELSRNLGLKIFYRLGTSIEHTSGVHFNACIPKDFDKTAEIFAGTVRHYNCGWADGKRWDIDYWEIWNEPDGTKNMWWRPEVETGTGLGRKAEMRDQFIEFFVTCMKRLKSEFPEIKVGGPALCGYNEDYFTRLLEACKAAGVAPDFLSWHYYGCDPRHIAATAEKGRALCDRLGFPKCELIVNEWHYILSWDGIHGKNSTPAMVKRALEGPTGHNNIDSACFALSTLISLQGSALSMANYYGCSHQGNWGYMDVYRQPTKPWYALCLFGSLMKDYQTVCASESGEGTVSVMPVRSADGKRKALLVSDYRGTDQVIRIAVRGVSSQAALEATVLDHTRDNLPTDVRFRDGELTLVKPDKNSSAWLVSFR